MANVRKNELTDFGRQVKNILSEKKITQSQLGETLGIAQNSLSTRLSRYEIGYDKMLFLFKISSPQTTQVRHLWNWLYVFPSKNLFELKAEAPLLPPPPYFIAISEQFTFSERSE